MIVGTTISKRPTEPGESRIGNTVVDLIKAHKFNLKLHVRFCIALLLLLGVIITVPTEFLVEVSIISAKLPDPTEFSLPANALNAVKSSEEVKIANPNVSRQEPFIQDLVILPEELLLLVRLPYTEFRFSGKDTLSCRFHSNASAAIRGVEYIQGRAAVRCAVSDPATITEPIDVVLRDSQTGAEISAAEGAKLKNRGAWVFELWATEKDVVVFAKGINRRRGTNVNASELRCVYDGGRYETRVTVSAQELFRCEHPPAEARQEVVGKPVTLRWEGELVETVAYYEERSGEEEAEEEERQAEVCACTVIYNVAKFLPEWVMYHAHVGVERFVFYDNNSDDDLDEMLSFVRSKNVAVEKYPWPWPKTQEAAFSHCALSARHVCRWMLFTDVDEFLFPGSWLSPPHSAAALPPLNRMLQDLTSFPATTPLSIPLHSHSQLRAQIELPSSLSTPLLDHHPSPPRKNSSPAHTVGQLSFKCHDFGPSQLTRHPPDGVTQGYTCRTRRGERHKSLVLLRALPDELTNVVHHFDVRPSYRTLWVDTASAVVNHYKFQAWPEFRRKFRRRVSAYVADWKESRNLHSRDRAPGLGFHEAKPPLWESSFCEVQDTALRDYTRTVFTLNVNGEPKLAWEL